MTRLLPPPAYRLTLLFALLIAASSAPGCGVVSRGLGKGIGDGVLMSMTGETKKSAKLNARRKLLEANLVGDLGRQLGAGLREGAVAIGDDEREDLERTVEALIAVLAERTGRGLRENVSPEFRQMISKDIVGAFVDGLEEDLGDSLEETAEGLVTTIVETLRENIDSDATRLALSSAIRDSLHLALMEGRPGFPSVSETLELTLTQSLLNPMEDSVGDIAKQMEDSVGNIARDVNDTVKDSAVRTENTLKTVISALVIIIGVVGLMYALSRRQLARARESQAQARRGLESLGAALERLDDSTREQVLGKINEYRAVAGTMELPPQRAFEESPSEPSRSSAYFRSEPGSGGEDDDSV